MTDNNKIFLEIIHRFISIWREAKGGMADEEVRKQFSRVKIMKLLYFFCLFDEKRQIRNEQHLGNFVAYPLGPVNEESYNFLKSENGDRYLDSICKGEELNLDLQPELTDRIEHVFQANPEECPDLWTKLAKMPVDELVDLSHTVASWRNAYLYSDKREMDVESTIQEDRHKILDFLSVWQVA